MVAQSQSALRGGHPAPPQSWQLCQHAVGTLGEEMRPSPRSAAFRPAALLVGAAEAEGRVAAGGVHSFHPVHELRDSNSDPKGSEAGSPQVSSSWFRPSRPWTVVPGEDSTVVLPHGTGDL